MSHNGSRKNPEQDYRLVGVDYLCIILLASRLASTRLLHRLALCSIIYPSALSGGKVAIGVPASVPLDRWALSLGVLCRLALLEWPSCATSPLGTFGVAFLLLTWPWVMAAAACPVPQLQSIRRTGWRNQRPFASPLVSQKVTVGEPGGTLVGSKTRQFTYEHHQFEENTSWFTGGWTSP
jgi:hypothetical protein